MKKIININAFVIFLYQPHLIFSYNEPLLNQSEDLSLADENDEDD